MNSRLLLSLIVLCPGAAAVEAQDPAGGAAAHLDYLKLLKRGEDALKTGDAEGVLHYGRQALAAAIPECRIPNMKMKRSGASAHFLLACGASLKGDREEAISHLEKAADNGYTDGQRIRTEKALASVRRHSKFRDLKARFPERLKADSFAGKTVKDQKFGMGLIHARKDNFPKIGERAPDFDLDLFGQKGSVRLSSFEGKCPVVLVFGSYT